MVKILSWNTLESGEGGAWSNGWGCPLEIRRRETLAASLQAESKCDAQEATASAEALLTRERYGRLRKTLLGELSSPGGGKSGEKIDFLLFQECTAGNFWDEPSVGHPDDKSPDDDNRKRFDDVFGSLYEKVPCRDDDDDAAAKTAGASLQHVYVRKSSGWKPTVSVPLLSEALVGGCLAEFVFCGGDRFDDGEEIDACQTNDDEMAPSLILVNLHGKSHTMRDPNLRKEGIANLWEEIEGHFRGKPKTDSINEEDSSWKTRIVLCGDWNTQLSDLVDPFRTASSDEHDWLEPVVGLLDNATTATTNTNTGYPYFSTNHEDGYLAQYDGCLFLTNSPPGSPSYLELHETSWNLTGFMPKGTDGLLSGEQPVGAAPLYNNFTYHGGSDNGENDNDNNNGDEGVYLNGVFLPGSMASTGLSDHVRIYTTIRTHPSDDNTPPAKDTSDREQNQWRNPTLQRRPYRRYEDEKAEGKTQGDGEERDGPETSSDEESGSRGLRG